jgi:hypothetical protein
MEGKNNEGYGGIKKETNRQRVCLRTRSWWYNNHKYLQESMAVERRGEQREAKKSGGSMMNKTEVTRTNHKYLKLNSVP